MQKLIKVVCFIESLIRGFRDSEILLLKDVSEMPFKGEAETLGYQECSFS